MHGYAACVDLCVDLCGHSCMYQVNGCKPVCVRKASPVCCKMCAFIAVIFFSSVLFYMTPPGCKSIAARNYNLHVTAPAHASVKKVGSASEGSASHANLSRLRFTHHWPS
jgi:hypothetical protein